MRFLILVAGGWLLAAGTTADDGEKAGRSTPILAAADRPSPEADTSGLDGPTPFDGRGRRAPDGAKVRSDDDRGLDEEERGGRAGRHFGHGGPDERPGGPRFGPGPEKIDDLMAFLKEYYPKMHERLNELRGSDPHGFRRQMFRMFPKIRELREMKDRNRDLFEKMIREHQLEMEIRDTVVAYRAARSTAAREELRKHLADLVSEQFDARQERLRLMIAELERELELKKKQLAEHAARKEKIIEAELQHRLREDT